MRRPQRQLKVLIVHDSIVVRQLLMLVAQASVPRVHVHHCATLTAGRTALKRNRPDLVIFDYRLKDGNGLELVQTYRQRLPQARWLFLSAIGRLDQVEQAVSLGVQGFVSHHPDDVWVYREAIQTLLAGGSYSCHRTSQLLAGPKGLAYPTARSHLTTREREVLHWITEGKRNAEIAKILGNKASTVKSQVESILLKLGVETRGAAAAASRSGWTKLCLLVSLYNSWATECSLLDVA